ncbi:MAG: alpha/beta hydrolase [Bacteroidota bacterium]
MTKQLIAITVLLTLLSCVKEDPVAAGILVPKTVDQDPSLPSLIINGTHLHVETYGQADDPILLMIHGGPGGDYRSMLEAKAFAADGFFVLFYDQRGTGLSKREDKAQFGDNGIQLFVEDLDALIDHVRRADSQKVFLFGHSWGAMLATAYLNQFPEKIAGAILAEPGGLSWTQTKEYLSRSNRINIFSEALNDAIFTEQIFAGRSEHEILDYKAAYFATFENANGNTLGNAGPYPFWRNGAVSFDAMIDAAERVGFDFRTNLSAYSPTVLFMYSELNEAYGREWAQTVSAPFFDVKLVEVADSGHEMLYFGWTNLYPEALTYLTQLK